MSWPLSALALAAMGITDNLEEKTPSTSARTKGWLKHADGIQLDHQARTNRTELRKVNNWQRKFLIASGRL